MTYTHSHDDERPAYGRVSPEDYDYKDGSRRRDDRRQRRARRKEKHRG